MTDIAWVHPHRGRVTSGKVDCVSVKIPGKKIQYTAAVVLKDVKFVIHQSGVKKAQEGDKNGKGKGQRNVHAWAKGTLLSHSDTPLFWPAPLSWEGWGFRKVTYYFQEGYFRDFETYEPVTSARLVVQNGRDCWYI